VQEDMQGQEKKGWEVHNATHRTRLPRNAFSRHRQKLMRYFKTINLVSGFDGIEDCSVLVFQMVSVKCSGKCCQLSKQFSG
jgi:hypothetical protein